MSALPQRGMSVASNVMQAITNPGLVLAGAVCAQEVDVGRTKSAALRCGWRTAVTRAVDGGRHREGGISQWFTPDSAIRSPAQDFFAICAYQADLKAD
jgi:hypothetical protein